MDLLLLNILSYSLFDIWLSSTTTSLFLCYLVDSGVVYLRRKWGQVLIIIISTCFVP